MNAGVWGKGVAGQKERDTLMENLVLTRSWAIRVKEIPTEDMLSQFYTTATTWPLMCLLLAPNLGDPRNHCFGPVARQHLRAETYGRVKEWQPLNPG